MEAAVLDTEILSEVIKGKNAIVTSAVAHRLNLPVVTGNTAHSEAMRRAGLEIALQNWREPL